jgi:23S rRNA (guanine2445-N2)-methyltransferase / 23S rRNA (guanine2069-N7)-methyltransferase
MRQLIQQQAKGKKFLNLFAYTGTVTVNAAQGGAKSTTTVDMSNTYLDWAKNNFDLNKMKGEHNIIRADCREWLQQQSTQTNKPQFDIIFLDPPTFSNSKRMEEHFDIQEDHVELIKNALTLLSAEGTLYFSTNFKKFKLDEQAFSESVVKDISASTIPDDYSRNPKIHYCWKIQN